MPFILHLNLYTNYIQINVDKTYTISTSPPDEMFTKFWVVESKPTNFVETTNCQA